MTLVQILQKLRDDLMQWGTANFEAVNTNFNTVNTNLNAVSAKVSSLQESSTTKLADLEKRVSTNETNISSNDTDISNLDTRITASESDIDALEEKTEYIDGTDDSALFIIDKDENVVAYFDAEGLHTTDIEAQNLSLRDGITQNGEQFFIIDKDENVAAYIDGEGTHVTNLYVNNTINVENDRIIIDPDLNRVTVGKKQVVINDHQILLQNTEDLNAEDWGLTQIAANGIAVLGAKESAKAIIQDIEISQSGITQRDVPAAEYNDKFFIIDSKDQVAAYIDGEGTHVTNLYADKDLEVTGSSILSNILTVAGKTTLNNELEVAGKTTLNDSLYVAKETNTNTLNVRSTSNLVGDLIVQANTDLNGTLNVDGHTTMTTLTTSNNVNVGGSLEVTGTFKSANLDATGNDSFFIVDKDMYVVAYFNAGGLYITDVTTKGIKFNENTNTYEKVVASNAGNYSVNQTLVDLLNNIINHTNRITTIENRLDQVSNVMDFIGVFQTVAQLEAYAIPNNGDVAVVIENQTEYIYEETQGWVEFGYSSYTMDKLIELEERLDAEIDDRTNADKAINYRGDFIASTDISSPERGDIAVIGGFLQRYTGETWEAFNGLSQKLYFVNGEESEKAFFTAQDETVVCYIDATGLHTTDIFAKMYLNVEGGAAINGTTTLGSSLIVHGSADLQSTLNVSGESTFDNYVEINARKNNVVAPGVFPDASHKVPNVSLKTTGTIIAGIATISPQVTTSTLNVLNNTELEKNVNIGENLAVNGDTTIYGNTIINGDTGLTVKNTATIGEADSANTNFTVNGDSVFNGDVNIYGTETQLTIQNKIQTKDLGVSGAAVITNLNVNDDLFVDDQISANGNIITKRDFIADGDVRAKNFTSEDSEAIYFIDSGENVGVYIDGAGLHTHTFEAQQITTRYKDNSGVIHSTTNNMINVMYFDVEDEITVTF